MYIKLWNIMPSLVCIHSIWFLFISALQVVAKGQVELMGRVPSSNKIINLRITEKMVPAFRFLAYYFIANEGRQEIVADSVWVDVMDVCEGKVLSKQVASVIAFQNMCQQSKFRPGFKKWKTFHFYWNRESSGFLLKSIAGKGSQKWWQR